MDQNEMWLCQSCDKENEDSRSYCEKCRTPAKLLSKKDKADDVACGNVQEIRKKLEQATLQKDSTYLQQTKVKKTFLYQVEAGEQNRKPDYHTREGELYQKRPIKQVESSSQRYNKQPAETERSDEDKIDRNADYHTIEEELYQGPPIKQVEYSLQRYDKQPSKKERSESDGIGRHIDSDISMVKPNERRIVLIGKSGTGKSATANTIIGKKIFKSMALAIAVTAKCQLANGDRFGKKLVLVDTPGLYDPEMTNEKVKKEIIKCFGMTAPGPHAFLLVVQIGRFTEEEHNTVKLFAEYFGNEMFKYLIVVFTRKDDLEGETIHSFVQKINNKLKDILLQCDYRYIAFNNKLPLTGDESSAQAKLLVDKIDKMVTLNDNRFYTNDYYKEAELAIRKREEELKRELEESKSREIENMTRNVSKQYEKKIEELQKKIERESKEKTLTKAISDFQKEQKETEQRLKDEYAEKIAEQKRELEERFTWEKDCVRDKTRKEVEEENIGFLTKAFRSVTGYISSWFS